jgi:hypothetical protein
VVAVVISERAIHDMVMEAIVAANNGKPMPDFGVAVYGVSREQMTRLNKAYDEARNQYAARRWRTRR